MRFSWSKIRNGTEGIGIPIYSAEGALENTPDKKTHPLQMDPLEKNLIADCQVNFQVQK